MKSIKVSELTGATLDWAVQMAEGYVQPDPIAFARNIFKPSTDWAQGGPIIEREGITTICWNKNPDQWHARRWLELDGPASTVFKASTPLIAAMSCYVASNLGDDVEIPEELK